MSLSLRGCQNKGCLQLLAGFLVASMICVTFYLSALACQELASYGNTAGIPIRIVKLSAVVISADA